MNIMNRNKKFAGALFLVFVFSSCGLFKKKLEPECETE